MTAPGDYFFTEPLNLKPVQTTQVKAEQNREDTPTGLGTPMDVDKILSPQRKYAKSSSDKGFSSGEST